MKCDLNAPNAAATIAKHDFDNEDEDFRGFDLATMDYFDILSRLVSSMNMPPHLFLGLPISILCVFAIIHKSAEWTICWGQMLHAHQVSLNCRPGGVRPSPSKLPGGPWILALHISTATCIAILSPPTPATRPVGPIPISKWCFSLSLQVNHAKIDEAR
jgi:hypothetical protein